MDINLTSLENLTSKIVSRVSWLPLKDATGNQSHSLVRRFRHGSSYRETDFLPRGLVCPTLRCVASSMNFSPNDLIRFRARPLLVARSSFRLDERAVRKLQGAAGAARVSRTNVRSLPSGSGCRCVGRGVSAHLGRCTDGNRRCVREGRIGGLVRGAQRWTLVGLAPVRPERHRAFRLCGDRQ